jgi:hypothetical protein
LIQSLHSKLSLLPNVQFSIHVQYYAIITCLLARSQLIEGSEKQGTFLKQGKDAQSKLSPQLKAITLHITDSCELTYGTGILRRVALPAENDSPSALTPTLCLITAFKLIPSGEDAVDARVEVAAPGATDFARHELVT